MMGCVYVKVESYTVGIQASSRSHQPLCIYDTSFYERIRNNRRTHGTPLPSKLGEGEEGKGSQCRLNMTDEVKD